MSGFFCQFLSICTEFYRVFNNYYTISSPIPPPCHRVSMGVVGSERGRGWFGVGAPLFTPPVTPLCLCKGSGNRRRNSIRRTKEPSQRTFGSPSSLPFSLSLSLSLFIYSISLYDPLIKRGSLGSRKCRLATERRRIKIKSKAENVKKIGKKVHFFGLPLKKRAEKKTFRHRVSWEISID